MKGLIILNELDFITEEEFLKKKENSSDLLEYGDGKIYTLSHPSTKHQRVCMILSNLFFDYFKNTACEVFTAPYDIILRKENMDDYWVIPDLSVLCDKSCFTDSRYEGVPHLIVEIVNTSNQSDDFVRKLNVYQRYGVKEYWIVNPINESVMIYSLDDKCNYHLDDITIRNRIAESKLFNGLELHLDELYKLYKLYKLDK